MDEIPTLSAHKQVQSSPSNSPQVSLDLCTSHTSSPSHSSLPTVSETEPMDSDVVSQEKINETSGDDMADDESVYLEPTEDQPFRRARRYTIT